MFAVHVNTRINTFFFSFSLKREVETFFHFIYWQAEIIMPRHYLTSSPAHYRGNLPGFSFSFKFGKEDNEVTLCDNW